MFAIGDGRRAGRRRRALVVLVLQTVAVLAMTGVGLTGAQAAPAPGDVELRFSTSADRSGSLALDGARVSGRVAIYLASARVDVETVTFGLDGTTVQVEHNAPWNFSGNTGDESGMLDTSTLTEGRHVVDADIATTEGVERVSAVFAVGGAWPPVGDGPELLVSSSADYAAPQPLGGSILSGRVAVFVRSGPDTTSVTFELDGRPVRVERQPPFDLSADTAGTSHLLDTSTLTAGEHEVTAVVTSSGREPQNLTARFRTARPTTPPATTRVLTVDGDRFRLDDEPFDMWGIRTASATHTQAQTDHLIDQLDTYRAHGVNTVAVYYMGSRNASYDPFSADGTSIDAGHQARMEQIIRAADQRGMVVVVGIFYQAAPLGLRDAAAVREAVRTVTTALRPYRNVVLNIANEHNSQEYADTAHVFDFRPPERVIELVSVVNAVDPGRVVGGGGYARSSNIVIGRSAESDVLLFDTVGSQQQLAEYRSFLAAGITKPVVNVEQFGAYTNNFPRGVFPAEVKAKYRAEISSAAAHPGLSTFFHNGPWVQVLPMRYDLGGSGTADDPGIAWYFEAVREATGTGPGAGSPTSAPPGQTQ